MRVKSVPVAVSGNGDNQLVAAQTGAVIRVVGYVLMSRGTVNAKFQSSSGPGTDLTGALPLTAQAGAVAPITPRASSGLHDGWFDTNAGEKLNLNLSAGVEVDGHVSYIIVPQ